MKKEYRCPCCISVIFLEKDNRYYLNKRSNLHHSGHVPTESKTVSSSEMDDDQKNLLHILSDVGLSPSKISRIFDRLYSKNGFVVHDKKIIANLIQEHSLLKREELGITPEMSTVDRAIAYLSA